MFGKTFRKMVDMSVKNELLRRDLKAMEGRLISMCSEKFLAERQMSDMERRHKANVAEARINERIAMWYENGGGDNVVVVIPYQFAIDYAVAIFNHERATMIGARLKRWVTYRGLKFDVHLHTSDTIRVLPKDEYERDNVKEMPE